MEAGEVDGGLADDESLVVFGEGAEALFELGEGIGVAFAVRVVGTPDHPVGAEHPGGKGEGFFVGLAGYPALALEVFAGQEVGVGLTPGSCVHGVEPRGHPAAMGLYDA